MQKNIYRTIGFGAMAVMAVLIGLYPAIYFIIERTFGLLRMKTGGVLNDPLWNLAFYMHIILGGLALLIGWTQFSGRLRRRNVKMHRNIGKVYIVSVVLSAVGGVHIGFYATGGWISSIGFISLGIIWLYTTVNAYTSIRGGDVKRHSNFMTYSYAACFAAVTLRIWLPLLSIAFGDFFVAYRMVAWLSWVPNLLVAYWLVKSSPEENVTHIA